MEVGTETIDMLTVRMSTAIQLAKEAAATGNYALGSLVLLDGEIIGESGSSLIADNNDPSAHPEMIAVRAAAARLQSRYLSGAILLSTLEPCPMCTSVAIWAKMSAVAFGASQSEAIGWAEAHPSDIFTWRQIRMSARAVAAVGDPVIHVVDGIRHAECVSLFELTGIN